ARPRVYLKPNGQYIVDLSIAQPWDVIRRDPARLPLLVHYFQATLEFARARGIRTLVIMPPMRDVEFKSYRPGEVEALDAWIAKTVADGGGTYLNYATHPDFSIVDFADITHLNAAGADRFSVVLRRDLQRLGIAAN